MSIPTNLDCPDGHPWCTGDRCAQGEHQSRLVTVPATMRFYIEARPAQEVITQVTYDDRTDVAPMILLSIGKPDSDDYREAFLSPSQCERLAEALTMFAEQTLPWWHAKPERFQRYWDPRPTLDAN
ncbi:hypothetical protein [Tsukamurella soli]|uniref:Uncharacterized protein n=1 Tax=Tsukamurella soli TaxID=644556 RepID=A0ABP8JTB7_9ACTN